MLIKKIKAKFSQSRGFTLYELLISAAVISLIAGIVIYNHKRFETDIEVTNLAYRMALQIREAQIYGISVRQFSGAGALGFDASYGIHFDRDVDNAFILFADVDGNGVYNDASPGGGVNCPTAPGTECVEKVTIGRNNKITGWCGILWSNTSSASQPCGVTDPTVGFFGAYQYIDFKFKRPNPDAVITWYNAYTPAGTSASFNRVCTDIGGASRACNGWAICLESPQGRKKRVVVYETGQISVESVEAGTVCSNVDRYDP